MSTTNRYDPFRPEHKVTCTRTKCAELERAPHAAGRHLSQRDEFYDGPDIQLAATSMYVRGSARKIITDAPALMPEVVDLVTYIDFLEDQATHARVDRDRGIREAMARSGDCEVHGEEIKGLGEQLGHLDVSQHRTERGRLALLGFLHSVDEALSGTMRPDLTVAELVAALKRAAKTTHAAHDRAWKS